MGVVMILAQCVARWRRRERASFDVERLLGRAQDRLALAGGAEGVQ